MEGRRPPVELEEGWDNMRVSLGSGVLPSSEFCASSSATSCVLARCAQTGIEKLKRLLEGDRDEPQFNAEQYMSLYT